MGQQIKYDDDEYIAEALSTLMSNSTVAMKEKVKHETIVPGKMLLVIVLLVITGSIFTITGIKLLSNQNEESLDASKVLTSVTDYKPYYFDETNLPQGIDTKKVTTKHENGILFISAPTPSGQLVTISQQKVPSSFASSIPTGTDSIDISYGKGAVSEVEGATVVNIISDDGVFIFVSAPSGVSKDTLASVARSLKQP